MAIEQITIFLENRPGRLSRITSALSESGIPITAMVLTDTADFGILHLIVKETERALSVLKDQGFAAKKTPVAIVEVKENPQDINRIMMLFREADINIEYMYAFTSQEKNILVLRYDNLEKGLDILASNGISIMTGDL
ncbi:MAG: amino acid-binding protein [Desulfobacteraceae bacterium]|jgi:hypothetical protein|nr:amino acid-binding protein [Desulfobacteraceae bacterium]